MKCVVIVSSQSPSNPFVEATTDANNTWEVVRVAYTVDVRVRARQLAEEMQKLLPYLFPVPGEK
jgi:hypothetical protein